MAAVNRLTFLLIVWSFPSAVILAQEPEVYYGKFLGKLNSYHHQVAGEVYAVDETTFLIKSFIYDGLGPDTFFWVGSSPRPGPQGLIVSDENGKTNVLGPYLNKDFTLKVPEQKKITDFRWFSVYDLTQQEAYGDVSISEGFEPPAPQVLTELSKRGHKVTSAAIQVSRVHVGRLDIYQR